MRLHEEALHTVAVVCQMPFEFGVGYSVAEQQWTTENTHVL